MNENDGEATCVSVCSGIGGMDYGLALAGFRHVLLCESDPWRRDVLRARFPGVPIEDDIRAVALGEPAGRAAPNGRGAPDHDGRWETRAGLPSRPTLVAGGTPCQDLSVAGRRAGLIGERSGLFHEYARVVDALRPRWFLWENVPGAFSSNGGRDFGVVIATLADIGYGVAWRLLDSRYFGVPQRRRRVFVVGTLIDGDPRVAAERAGQVLAVGSRCPRHPATRGEEGQNAPGSFDGGAISTLQKPNGGWRIDAEAAAGGHLIPVLQKSGPPGSRRDDEARLVIAETVRSHPRPGSNSNGNLVGYALRRSPGGTGQGHNTNYVTAFSHTQGLDAQPSDKAWPTLRSEGGGHAVGVASQVRRLTPTECERLQGLPDGWTQLGNTPDSPRYAALGDAVTAPVALWIGSRILASV